MKNIRFEKRCHDVGVGEDEEQGKLHEFQYASHGFREVGSIEGGVEHMEKHLVAHHFQYCEDGDHEDYFDRSVRYFQPVKKMLREYQGL
ncbi:MAG: hypothetical protein ABFR33_09540 [Verrucomicrobiota bacterium]